VRVIQGAGEGLNSVRKRYDEPPAMDQPDIVVCAGALDIPVPASIVGHPLFRASSEVAGPARLGG